MKMKHLLKKAFLLLALIGGTNSAWAADYEWSDDGQKTTLSVTAAKGSSAANHYTGYSISYGGTTYTKAIKMESATTITFTTSATSTITIGIALKNGSNYAASGKATVKLTDTDKYSGGVVSESAISVATTGSTTEDGVDVTFTDVAAGTVTIGRGGSELGVFYIKVHETGSVMTKLSTPEISYNASTGAVTIGSVANATKVTYTTDGKTPTASSVTYSDPFVVEDGTVVKAIAIGDGESYSNSDVASETVYLTGITCATPVINSFNGTVAISTTTPNATIKYSTDGGSNYDTYSRSFTLTDGATVQAYAEREGCTTSEEASKVVNILPTSKTNTVYLNYDDFTIETYTATGKTGTPAEGYVLTIGKEDKSWTSGSTITILEEEVNAFKLSNGAQNTLTIPGGVHVTKLTIYSTVNTGKNGARVCGWKEVGGVDYQTGEKVYTNVPMGAFSDVADYNTNPDVRVYDIDQTGGTVTFTNAGEQLFFVIGLDIFDESAENATITPANAMSTYVAPAKLDFSGVSGLKAYVATAAAGGTVTLEEVGAVPAGTPLMLVGTAGTEYTVPVAASASAPANNMFVAGDGTTEFDGTTYDYILYTDGKFYKIGSGTVAKNKAYLHCNVDPTSALGRSLTISYGDKLTGIDQVENVEVKSSLPVKRIVNGNLVIEKNGVSVNAAGAKLY